YRLRPLGAGSIGTGHFLRRHLHSGTRPHQAVDDDAVVGVEPRRNHAQALDQWTKGDVLRPRHVIAVEHQHELADLFGANRDVGQQYGLAGRTGRDLDAAEHAGGEPAVGVGEFRPAADGARGAVNGVVDEVGLADMRELRLIDQFQPDGDAGAALIAAPSLAAGAQTLEIGGLIHGELEADWVDRGDGGEQGGATGGATGHQVAGRYAPVADAPGHRRPQLREIEVEFGLAHGRLLRLHRGLGHA